MSFYAEEFPDKSRLRVLLDHFAVIEDDREPWRVAHPLLEVLLLVVCGTIADCDDFEFIAEWGEAHLDFLRRFLPYHHGVPTGRWLNALMNRIDPGLFAEAFTSWVRETLARTARASTIFHNHPDWLRPADMVSQQTRQNIGAAPRGQRDDDLDRFRRLKLRAPTGQAEDDNGSCDNDPSRGPYQPRSCACADRPFDVEHFAVLREDF